VAWTVVGVAIARRLDLSETVWRLEALLAVGVAASMVAMTAATAIWWAALARSAPSFVADAPLGAATAAMALAAVAATAGAGRAARPRRGV
jgi:hypothetical protein